jgi:hypothetical protein
MKISWRTDNDNVNSDRLPSDLSVGVHCSKRRIRELSGAGRMPRRGFDGEWITLLVDVRVLATTNEFLARSKHLK